MKKLLAAATDWRTLIWLGAGLVAAAVLTNPFPALIGLGIYLWAVQKLAHSPALAQAAERAQTAEGLAERYRQLQATIGEVADRLPRTPGPGEDRSSYHRAADVVTAARTVYNEWLAHPEQHADKAPRVDEALQLADLYLRILRAYYMVYTGQRAQDLAAVKERIARNQRRLEASMDLEARRTLAEAIEMDERVLAQATDEEAERERYQAKLAAIESTMDLLRRQIFDPEHGANASRLRDMLLEAEAVDQALGEVEHRTRVRVR